MDNCGYPEFVADNILVARATKRSTVQWSWIHFTVKRDYMLPKKTVISAFTHNHITSIASNMVMVMDHVTPGGVTKKSAAGCKSKNAAAP